MSYQQFLDTLTSPISAFLSWLGSLSDYLLTNYIFITLLGIEIFVFLLTLVYSLILKVHLRKKRESNKYN